MVSKDTLKKISNLLKEDKERLEENLEALKNMDFGDAPGQDNEEADETEEMSNKLATIHLLERRLHNIEDALDRIKAGTYGACIRCGGEISEEILKINPESSLCKNCKV